MPSFPDSVFAPANRSNGQTIDASHMNGVQDEIVAIEGGYINGTARLNSSVLNVTGTSTFASRPVMPPPAAVSVGIVSTMTIGGTSTAVNWTKQDYAINSSLHSTTTNSSRFTPDSTGVWQISANVIWRVDGTASTGTNLVTQLLDSSGTEIALARVVSAMTATEHGQYISRTRRVDVTGTWFSVTVSQSGGSSMSLSTQSSAEFRKL